jgi:acetyl esterase/lipase
VCDGGQSCAGGFPAAIARPSTDTDLAGSRTRRAAYYRIRSNSIALNPDIRTRITARTPPTFLLQNEDDDVDRVEDSLSYCVALKKARVPVEMHLYAQGGHAFGLRRTQLPVTAWPLLVETRLGTIGMTSD